MGMASLESSGTAVVPMRAIVKDERDVEDVMQQAYVNAFTHLHQFAQHEHGAVRLWQGINSFFATSKA
jgi:hypothetical protein